MNTNSFNMKNVENDLIEIINKFRELPEIEAILLAGSRAAGNVDEDSDYDIYIYSKEEIPAEKRLEILMPHLSYLESNHQIWETEDLGILPSGIYIDFVYRNTIWMEERLENLLVKHQVSTGYSTCFWGNLMNSVILFDRNGWAQDIKNTYDIPYSDELREAIIDKNYGLMRTIIPAYSKQIEKAQKREDIVSIHHRTTALLESYFDIMFAVNKIKHPGEKKILQILSRDAKYLPEHMVEDITELITQLHQHNFDVVKKLQVICDRLDYFLFHKPYLAGK